MARIINNNTNCRRIIKLSVSDILSIVQDYQRIVPRNATREIAEMYLSDKIIYIPEEI
jgi:hypothetical protein